MTISMLTFASIWALEGLALEELQMQISEVDSTVKIQYEPTGHLLAIQGNISQVSEIAIARLVRNYLEDHKSDDLLEAPRLRQIASVSAEDLWLDKKEPRPRDENAIPTLIPNDDPPADANVVQRWMPATSMLKYFECDDFGLLLHIARSTKTEIVNEKATANEYLTIKGSTYGEAQQAIEKLTVLQPALALVETPYTANMVIATECQTKAYHVMNYASINPTSLSRILFDPALVSLPRILTSRAPVTWTFRMDQRNWAMLDQFCNPPNLKAAWKHEQDTMENWKEFVFRKLGNDNEYSSLPLSTFHLPRAHLDEPTNADVASKHPFLNPEKAKDVNKWVALAQDEDVNSSPAIVSQPRGLGNGLESSTVPGPHSKSAIFPKPPLIERYQASTLAKATVAGIKKRKLLTVKGDDAKLTARSTIQPGEASSAPTTPSLATEPPESIENGNRPPGGFAKLGPAPSSSHTANSASRGLAKLQTVPIDRPNDYIDGINQNQIPLERKSVVSIASKHNPEDLIDLSWEPGTEIDLPASPRLQLASLDSSSELLIPDLEAAPEESRASPVSEIPISKDLISLGSPPFQAHVPPDLIENKNIPTFGGLLPEVSSTSALIELEPSQNTDLISLTSEAETVGLTGDLPKDSTIGASRSDQQECGDLLTGIQDAGHLQRAPEASIGQKPALSNHSLLPLHRSLVSPSVSAYLLESGSIARKYLLGLCPGDLHSGQNNNSFGTDGPSDNLPQPKLLHSLVPTAGSLRGERTSGDEGNGSLIEEVNTREFHSLMKQQTPNTKVKYDKVRADEVCKKYAQAARAKNRVNQRILREGFKSKEHTPQTSPQSESTGTPKEEVSSTDIAQIKNLFSILKQVLEPVTCWPGLLNFEVQLGLMLLPGGPKKSERLRMSLDGLKRFHAPQDGLAAPSVTFLERLTTCPVDMDHIIDLQANGFRLFEKKSLYAEVLFEFHCERGSSKFIITVFQNGTHMINRPETLLGAVYLNFPSSVWDASLKIAGRINQLGELDEETQEAARSIAKNIWIEPNRSHVRLLTRRPRNLKIVKILMKRSTEHQHLQSEYPEDSEEMYLRVCETQDLIIQVTDLDDQVIQAHCSSLPEMTKANRQWWTASLVSPILNTYLSSNKFITPGEKTTDWTPVDLFGADAKFLVPASSEPFIATPERPRSTRLSSVATAIGGAGISGLVRLAGTVVERIDAVGWNNQGPASEINKGASSNGGVSENVTVIGDKKTGVMATVNRLAMVQTGRNSPAPVAEKSFW